MINTQFLDDIKIINEQNKYNFNKREIEVINLILQEYSTTRIAKTLGLNSNTISTFKKNIFFLKARVKSTIGLYKLIMKS
jgi:DNA-binding CsgD family transcriptional regulator